MKKIPLHWQIMIALLLGVIFGVMFPQHTQWVSWMGQLFLRALQMIIVPLIFSSITTAVAGIGNSDSFGRLGVKTFGYYIFTSLVAIITGLILVNIIQPGVGAEISFTSIPEGIGSSSSFKDALMNIIPVNILRAMVNGDMIAIIFFAMLFGFSISRVPEQYGKPIKDFFTGVFEVMMKVTMYVIRFSPLGIFGIVAVIVAEQSLGVFISMGKYMITVLLGLAIHGFLTLPLMVKILGKVNPIQHFRNLSIPLLTAFSTSSSSATLPFTIEAVEKRSGVSNKVSGFVLPMGATINMNGTALYECAAVMFIAQVYGIEMSFSQQVIIVIMALLTSIGAAGIPMAGLVTMTAILSAVGLPLEGIGLILAVDRILDMFRTSLNVFGDCCGAVIIAKSEGETLNGSNNLS